MFSPPLSFPPAPLVSLWLIMYFQTFQLWSLHQSNLRTSTLLKVGEPLVFPHFCGLSWAASIHHPMWNPWGNCFGGGVLSYVFPSPKFPPPLFLSDKALLPPSRGNSLRPGHEDEEAGGSPPASSSSCWYRPAVLNDISSSSLEPIAPLYAPSPPRGSWNPVDLV